MSDSISRKEDIGIAGDGCVLFFVKYPEKGRVKSRLARRLGDGLTVELYRNFVLDMLQTLKVAGMELRIFFYPPHYLEKFTAWLGDDYNYVPQKGGHLGERMENAFDHIFAEGIEKAVVIGSDSPDLPADTIRAAFLSLERYDAVIGPSNDGGYYLAGFRKETFLKEAFRGLQWSSEMVFAETMGILSEAGLKVSILGQWGDIDTLEDLKDLVKRSRHTKFRSSRTIFTLGSMDLDNYR